jgi:hypothetical protein
VERARLFARLRDKAEHVGVERGGPCPRNGYDGGGKAIGETDELSALVGAVDFDVLPESLSDILSLREL